MTKFKDVIANADPETLDKLEKLIGDAVPDSNKPALTPADNLTPENTTIKEDSSYKVEIKEVKNQYKVYASADPVLCKRLRMIGLGEIMIVKIIEHFKLENVYEKIFKEDPYNLMEIEGIGFTKADYAARQLGITTNDPRRQKALIRFTLETNKAFGNVYLPEVTLEKECKRQGVENFKERLEELIEKREVTVDDNRIYLRYLYTAECEVAEIIRDLLGINGE